MTQDHATALDELCTEFNEASAAKGFVTPEVNFDQKLLLIVGEISEAQEELRKGHTPGHIYTSEGGKPEGFVIELADALIRILQLAGQAKLSLGDAVRLKATYNATRPYKHGKVF